MLLLYEKDKDMLIDSDFFVPVIIQCILFLSPLTEDKDFSAGASLSAGTGCQERLPSLHPWRYLKLNWA